MKVNRPKTPLEQRYPTARAREVADKAIDELPESAPMTLYIDTWLAAYRDAGGKEVRKP